MKKRGGIMNLNINKIKENLGDKYADMQIFIYNSTDSTNTRAKNVAENSNIEAAVFIANEQTSGRGRLGRSFVSKDGCGLFLSILTKKPYKADEALNLTTYMANIAAEVIEKNSGVKIDIKWVNDLYVNGKKLAGILTEGKVTNNGTLDYSIIGIGINLFKQSYPDEIKNIATDIETESGKKIDINKLAGDLISSFFEKISLVGSRKIAKEYKKRSFIIGKEIRVIKLSEEYDAKVIDILDNCSLKIIKTDGAEEILSTGEVSIRATK